MRHIPTPYRKLLVTGHLGFIGSAFCHQYGQHYDITGVDFAGWGAMECNVASGIQDLRADIADADAMRNIIDDVQPDAIINFAAESHVDRSHQEHANFWRSNVIGAINLGVAASRLGIRLLQVSTDEVYGDASHNSKPWSETSPLAPTNPYAITKAAAELVLQNYAASPTHALDLVITRGANTIGPRQFPEKAIPKAIDCFTTGKPFPLYQTPARRMWMHVNDHVAGIEAALRKGHPGEVYNLAPADTAEAITEDVIRHVQRLIGNGEIEKVKDRTQYDLRYWMSARKAERELDWRTQYSLEDSIQETVLWYLENRTWLEEASRQLLINDTMAA